jgi:hypothetical protein
VKKKNAGNREVKKKNAGNRQEPPEAPRRAEETAAHCGAVLPEVDFRQWTVSLPWALRWPVLRKPTLLTATSRRLVEAIWRWQRHQAQTLGSGGKLVGGAVSQGQWFNSALQPAPHLHVLVPDGLWSPESGEFVPLPAPSDVEVEGVLRRVITLLKRDFEKEEVPWPEDDLGRLQAKPEGRGKEGGAPIAPTFGLGHPAKEDFRGRRLELPLWGPEGGAGLGDEPLHGGGVAAKARLPPTSAESPSPGTVTAQASAAPPPAGQLTQSPKAKPRRQRPCHAIGAKNREFPGVAVPPTPSLPAWFRGASHRRLWRLLPVPGILLLHFSVCVGLQRHESERRMKQPRRFREALSASGKVGPPFLLRTEPVVTRSYSVELSRGLGSSVDGC